MLIPSIDLMDGRVVQLEQGERLVIADDDVDRWVRKFEHFSIVQVIDLGQAKGRGSNETLVRELCGRIPCQVGGGVRTPEIAAALRKAGARRVIVGSALYGANGVDADRARAFHHAIGTESLIGAIDARGDRVAVRGWTSTVQVSPEEAAQTLDAYCGGLLFTNIDTEGLLTGFPIERVRSLQLVTRRRIIAAGGIRSADEVEALDRIGADAVVGMAIYRGLISV